MKNNKLFLGAVVALLSVVGCKKAEEDITSPVITITEPTLSTYTIDSTASSVQIPFLVTVSDNAELHEVAIELENTSDQSVLMHVHLHPDAAEITFDTTLTFSYTMMKNHTFTVTATDHSGNEQTATKDFHIHVE